MTTIAYIVENDGTVTTKRDMRGFDADPSVGSGAAMRNMDEMTAPADFDSAMFTFDPFVGA